MRQIYFSMELYIDIFKIIRINIIIENENIIGIWCKFIYNNICNKVNQQEIKSALVLTRDVTLNYL